MFSVILNSMGRARGALEEASGMVKRNSRTMQNIAADASGNYAIEKCRKSIEALADRLNVCHKETKELSECLQDIIDCYRETEETILESANQNSNTGNEVDYGMFDYQKIQDTMESLDIKFVIV